MFPCSKVIFNIRTNATDQLQSIENTFFSEEKSWKKTADDINETNEYMVKIAEALGEDMAATIDLSQWKKDVNVFNTLVDWLGFKNCHFNSIIHENKNGYGRDKMTDVGIEGTECQPP